jgi:PAS domain S-box-containing protein
MSDDPSSADACSPAETLLGETLYRSLIEQLPALTYICDAEGRTTYVYAEQVDKLLCLTDADRDMDIDERWRQRVHPDDRVRVLADWADAVASGTPSLAEYRMYRGDGRMIWVRDVESVITDDDGNFVRRQGVTFDITDLVQAREHAAEAEERFRSLTEQMPAVLYRDSADATEAIYVGPGVEEMFGYTPQEWIDGSMEWFLCQIHPDDRELVVAAVQQSVANQQPALMTYRIRHKDGRYIHVRDSVVFVAGSDGWPLWRQGMISDVTREVEHAQRLDQADQRFQALVEQVPAVIYLDHMDMTPIYVSPRVEEVLGCSAEAWMASTGEMEAIIGESQMKWVLAAYTALRDHGTPFLTEYLLKRPDGSERWVRDQARRVHDSDGQPFALQGVIVDITESKLVEQRVARHVVQQRMVADLGMRALAGGGWRQLARDAVEGVSGVLGVSHVSVLELGTDGDVVTMRAATGWPAEAVDSRTASLTQRPLLRRVLESEQLVQIPDVADASIWPDLVAAAGIRSAASVRIGSSPSYGLMSIHSQGAIAIDEQDVSFMQAVANVLAAAIHSERAQRSLEESELRRRQTLSQLLRDGEEQRQRIAIELHDDTIQVMTAALITLDREARAIADGDQLRAMAAVREMRETLHSAVDRTRRLAFELRPPVLEARGLAAALNDLLAEVGRAAGCEVELTAGTGRLAADIESLAYRTVQELVTNARKHSRASHLTVKLLGQPDKLDVEVADDGIGFEWQRVLEGGALRLNFGLESSAERITLAGGDFVVRSAPGEGTNVRFTIPLAAA